MIILSTSDPHLPISHLLVQYSGNRPETRQKIKTTDQPSTPIMVNEVWPKTTTLTRSLTRYRNLLNFLMFVPNRRVVCVLPFGNFTTLEIYSDIYNDYRQPGEIIPFLVFLPTCSL